MTVMHFDLQEGFHNDDVIVRINGHEVYHKTGVKTDLRLGLADSFEVNIADDDGPAKVEIALPSKGLAQIVKLAGSIGFVGIAIVDKQLLHRVSQKPFGYA